MAVGCNAMKIPGILFCLSCIDGEEMFHVVSGIKLFLDTVLTDS